MSVLNLSMPGIEAFKGELGGTDRLRGYAQPLGHGGSPWGEKSADYHRGPGEG